MPKRILAIIGHPDPDPDRFCRALAQSYVEGARSAGHEVRLADVATLDFSILRSMDEFCNRPLPATLNEVARAVREADHIVIVFPLWLGSMPALLKAFLEQIMRPGLAIAYPEKGQPRFTKTLLGGRSARVVVTMGMPTPIYRFWYLGHGLAALRRNILNFVGISPVRQTLFGQVEVASDKKRKKWLHVMRKLGAAGR